jgi:hypothetical protein
MYEAKIQLQLTAETNKQCLLSCSQVFAFRGTIWVLRWNYWYSGGAVVFETTNCQFMKKLMKITQQLVTWRVSVAQPSQYVLDSAMYCGGWTA